MRINNFFLLLFLAFAITACKSSIDQAQPKDVTHTKNNLILSPLSVSPSNVNASEPAIASLPDDSIIIGWVQHSENKDADLMIRKFDSTGNPKGESIRVNPNSGEVKAWFGDPPTIRVGQDGTIYIGWTAKFQDSAQSGTILYLSVSHDGGNSFEAPVKVNDDLAPASHGMHSLAVDKLGHVYFAWLDERYLKSQQEQTYLKENLNRIDIVEKAALFQHHQQSDPKSEPNAELYFAVSNDGGKTFSKNKRLAENVCPCCKTSLLNTPNGNIYVSWRQVLPGDFRHIAVATSTDNGNNFTSPVIVSDDKWEISACPVTGAALAYGKNDVLKVVWYTAGKTGKAGIYYTQSTDHGKSFSPRSLVYEGLLSGTPIFLSNAMEDFKIFWGTEDNLFVATEQTSMNNTYVVDEISAGQLPAAASSSGKYFISFVGNEGGKKSIRLGIEK